MSNAAGCVTQAASLRHTGIRSRPPLPPAHVWTNSQELHWQTQLDLLHLLALHVMPKTFLLYGTPGKV